MWNEDPGAHRPGLRLGPAVDLHPGAAVLRRTSDDARQHRRHHGRARARHLRRLGHHRPHQPAGAIKTTSPAGKYLHRATASQPADFNSYGSRRGNDQVMTRGTFANVRIKNLMVPAATAREEGGVTLLPARRRADADLRRRDEVPGAQGTPLGRLRRPGIRHRQSRDWAAKGTQLLGVKAVVAQSFERIHRCNLVGMGVLPLPVQGRRQRRSRSASTATRPSTSSASTAASSRSMDVTLTIHRTDGTRAERAGAAAHRHADRGRLLPPRRHPAVRAARARRARPRERAGSRPRSRCRACGPTGCRTPPTITRCAGRCRCSSSRDSASARSTRRPSIWCATIRWSWSCGRATPGRCWW